MLAVDRAGEVVDGDELMALAALHLRDSGRADRRRRGGDGDDQLRLPLRDGGGGRSRWRSTDVGDRYVLEELRARGWVLGGEQSGHIIDMGFNRTGDGIASALLTLEALAGRDLASATRCRSCRSGSSTCACATAGRSSGAAGVHEAVRSEEQALAGRGRVLVRPSGTEPLVRVMVEAPTDEEADAVCGRLVALVERELG